MAKELDYKSMGYRIKSLRLQHGIHQIKLAKLLEISQTHMSNIESGRAGITLENLVKMGEIFQCDLNFIVFGTEEAKAQAVKAPIDGVEDYSVDDVLKVLKILKAIK